MQTLINDLLHYSKFEDSNKELEELDCNELVNECLELLDQQIKEKNAEIKILNKLPKLKGRRSELIRVFQNLISNSIKYCEKQPVIEISSKELKDKSAHQFTIQDNGIGIAKEYQERIFRIFQRLHKDEEYSGTGLGLAITKKIIEAHGGSIYIESEPGQGSSFIFTISSSF